MANARRAETAEVVEKHRDVEVGSPLRRGTWFPARHRVAEVEEAADRLVAATFHRLAQVHGFGELPELFDDLRRDLRNPHRRGDLQFDDRDLGFDEGIEAGTDILELDRLVADVEHDAEVAAQGGGGGRIVHPASVASLAAAVSVNSSSRKYWSASSVVST